MVSPSLIWFFLKRSSKFFSLIFAFIAFMLLIFVQLSCKSPSQSKNYALDLRLNTESAIYSIINTTFNSDDSTQGFADLKFKIGVSGICLENLPVTINTPFSSTVQCYKSNYNFENVTLGDTNLYDALNIKIVNTKSTSSSSNSTLASTQVNLLDLSKHITNTIHPSLTTASLAIHGVTFLTVILTLLPKPWNLPFIQTTVAFISYLILHFFSLIVCGVNALFLRQISDKSYSNLLTKVSLNIIKTKSGGPFQRMIWISLLFQFLQASGQTVSFIRFFYNMNEEVEELKNFTDKSKNTDTNNINNSKYSLENSNFNISSHANPFSDYMSNKGEDVYDKYKFSSSGSSAGRRSTETAVNSKKYNDLYYYNV
ncbi:hypothetical protein ACO0SA_000540 [Hanseniaspora valbyensis]